MTTTMSIHNNNNNNNNMSSFSDFIQHQKPININKKNDDDNKNDVCKKNHFVVGNEAGDADSIISALSLAYINQRYSNNNNNKHYIPLVSIPRADMILRRDVTLLLEQECGVAVEKLNYIDDPCVIEALSNDTQIDDDDSVVVEITLTDHNKPAAASSLFLSPNVVFVEVLDHHVDEGFFDLASNNNSNNNSEIAFENGNALVGSCCTLVVERLMNYYSNIVKNNNNNDDSNIDEHLLYVLLSTIVLDTSNMSPTAGKGTGRDQRAIDFLLLNSNNSCDADCCNKVYHMLSSAKFDRGFWNSMPVRDCLRIDYKRYEFVSSSSANKNENDDASLVFGLSSTLLPTKDFINKVDTAVEFVSQVKQYMKEVQVSLLGVLSMVIDPETDEPPRREMLLCSITSDDDDGNGNGNGPGLLLADMKEYLMHHKDAQILGFHTNIDDEEVNLLNNVQNAGLRCVHLKCSNPKASRKQVAPVMMSFFVNK